jgi:hypothetical protein
MSRTLSEQRFEEYCEAKRIRIRPVAVGRTRAPDYDLFMPRRKVVVEVKEITPNPKEKLANAEAIQGVTVAQGFAPGDRLRKKITDASSQIKARTRGRYPGLLVH